MPKEITTYPWGWGNEVLYSMCEKEPHHSNYDIVSGKFWLIGRAYAVAIERGAGKERKENQDFHDTIAPKIVASDLDEWLKSVSDIRKIDLGNLDRVLSVHHEFTKLLKKWAGGLERRSFASKYLHFHNPSAFFIYDSRADKRVRQLVGRRRFDLPSTCKEFDKTYASFVLRCIEYRDNPVNSGEVLTPSGSY